VGHAQPAAEADRGCISGLRGILFLQWPRQLSLVVRRRGSGVAQVPAKRLQENKEFSEWELIWEASCVNHGVAIDPLWYVCITCSWYDMFLVRKVFETEPTAGELWDVLLEAMERPETCQRHRPKRLMVAANQGWEALKGQLDEIGIVLVKTKDLDYPDGYPEWMDDVWQEWRRRTSG
jgi:hypothetical protein